MRTRQTNLLLSWFCRSSRVDRTCKDLNSDSVLEENREEPRRQTGQNAREGAGLGEHMRRLGGEGQGAEQRPSCRAPVL